MIWTLKLISADFAFKGLWVTYNIIGNSIWCLLIHLAKANKESEKGKNSMMQYHPSWCIDSKHFYQNLPRCKFYQIFQPRKLLQLKHAGSDLMSVRWKSWEQSSCSMTWLQHIDWLVTTHEQVTTCCCLFIYLFVLHWSQVRHERQACLWNCKHK